jgi:tetratricopeptide (TPR) repeat protein
VGSLAILAGCGVALARAWPRLFPDALARGAVAYTRGDWSTAAKLARQRLEAVANDREALRLLARSSARRNRDSSAVVLYTRLGAGAMSAEDHFLLGVALSNAGQDQAAARAWEQAIQVDPNHAETLDRLALVAYRQHQLEKSAGFAERLSRRPGWEARGDLMLGLLRGELNDPAESAAALRRGLERDPEARSSATTPAKLRKVLARALLQIGQPAQAQAQVRAVLARGPDPEAAWLLSRACLQAGAIPQATAAWEQAGSYRADHPLELEPSPYVGEARCAECHRALFQAVRASRHARSFHRGPELKDLPVPDHPLPDPGDPAITHTFGRVGDQIRVETRVQDRVVRALVDYAFGTRDRYLTMTGLDERGVARALRLSYYRSAEGTGWGLTSGDSAHPDRPEYFLGRPIDVREGSIRCLYCHTTNTRGGRERTGPESADRGIGCERCHGPGGHHLAAVAAQFPDLAIASPALATAEGITRLCSQCHILNEGDMALTTPRTDPAWVRSQGETFPWSRCYTESGGTFTCVTCHDPHRNAEPSAAHYEARCRSCHVASSSTQLARRGEPTRPVVCPINATRDCIPCHMPKVRNELLHTSLTDHYIRVHSQSGDGG